MLLPIAVGIVHGRDEGAIAGFAAGLVLDLVVHGTPVGFFALGYTLTGYIVGMTQATVLRAAWWIPVLTAIGGSALGVADPRCSWRRSSDSRATSTRTCSWSRSPSPP